MSTTLLQVTEAADELLSRTLGLGALTNWQMAHQLPGKWGNAAWARLSKLAPFEGQRLSGRS
jgi:hypothetical protein